MQLPKISETRANSRNEARARMHHRWRQAVGKGENEENVSNRKKSSRGPKKNTEKRKIQTKSGSNSLDELC